MCHVVVEYVADVPHGFLPGTLLAWAQLIVTNSAQTVLNLIRKDTHLLKGAISSPCCADSLLYSLDKEVLLLSVCLQAAQVVVS